MIVMTDFSIFNGVLTVNKAVDFVKEKGFKKIVLADTNLSGALTFYYAAKKADIMPIIGVQGLFKNVKYLFIAHNANGYSLLTQAETYGYNEDIFNSENITAIAIDILDKDYKILSKFGIKKEVVNKVDNIINKILSEETNILPITLGNIIDTSDYYTLAAMNAVENKTQYEVEIANGNVYSSFIISEKEELTSSKEFLDIMAKCVDDYTFGDPTPPSFKFTKEVSVANGLSPESTEKDLFEFLCKKGLIKRHSVNSYEEVPSEYRERLEFEMNVINNMNFPGYFLIVFDFINEARRLDIPVGPGRGSAAGSLVAYSLEITDLDPLKFDLLFERFLNPERISLPDIDMDFCQNRREEVINYVIKKYGKANVAQVITFGKLAAKAAIKESARIIGAPLYLAEKMTKMVPDKPGTTLEKAYNAGKDTWDKMFEEDFIAKKIWDKAILMEGLKKNRGVHAAGLVISNDPIANRAPLYDVKGTQVVGYEGGFLEDVDLVKYDFLGLKTLTVIDNAVKDIKIQKSININMRTIDIYDQNIYDLISTGKTVGMFQIESPGMQDLNRRLRPDNFEDLIAVLALYRPGPMEAGMLDSFINRKHGREKIDYFFDSMSKDLEPILKPTYGLIVYQEQVMQIVQVIAGFTLGEADLVRRAMGKKKAEEMARISKEFVEKASKKGHDPKEAKELFDLIEKFAGYGFNKSHSAAYALVTYQTAWLKHYYPEFFMTHLINSEITNTDKFVRYIQEAKDLGIDISKPDVKTSTNEFSVINGNIVFGLKAIKGVGTGASKIIELVDTLEDNATILDLLKLTQRDFNKEIASLTSQYKKMNREYNSLVKSYNEAFERIQNLQAKITEKGILNKRDQKSFEKYSEILNKFHNDSNFNLQLKHEELVSKNAEIEELQKEFESSTTFDKIDKRVFEALSEVGAFDSFNVTRKDLLNNVANLLNMSKHSLVKFTGEEFSIAEKIAFEEARTGLILSDIFESSLKEKLLSKDIPEDNPIGIIVEKVEKRKKDRSIYYSLKLMLVNGDFISFSDFNNKTAKINVGDLCSCMIKMNGPYTNLLKINKATDKIISSYPDKKLVKKLTILEDIQQENLDKYTSVEVYDLNGDLIAIYSKAM